MKQKTSIQQIVIASVLLALGLFLPFFTMQIPDIGNKLLPMHLPILLCGFVLNWKYGLFLGFLTPILRSLIFSMPVLYPTAFAMAFELATYGFITALCYRLFPKKLSSIYGSLIIGMLAGRIVWGLVMMAIMSISQEMFTISIFYTSAVLNAIPGIILQLLIIPLLVKALQTAKVITI